MIKKGRNRPITTVIKMKATALTYYQFVGATTLALTTADFTKNGLMLKKAVELQNNEYNSHKQKSRLQYIHVSIFDYPSVVVVVVFPRTEIKKSFIHFMYNKFTYISSNMIIPKIPKTQKFYAP